MKKYTEDPRITAYALGELHGAEAEEIQRLIAQDPELQEYVEQIQATANDLSTLFKQETLVPLKPAHREKLEELTKPRMSFKAVWGGLGATLAVAGLALVISTREIKTVETQVVMTPEEAPVAVGSGIQPEKIVVADQMGPAVEERGVIKKKARASEDIKAGYAEENVLEEVQAQVVMSNPALKSKKFNSIKQGGSAKQAETTGANAQNANKDANKVGMLAAFGGGGMRKSMDKAYSTAGNLGESAKSVAGAGNDIGAKFKDAEVIPGVGTKGRGAGYGAASALVANDSFTIDLDGAEARFEGIIDQEAVRRVARAGLREIRGCYEQESKKLTETQRLEGQVTIALRIDDSGKAVSTTVESSNTGNRDFESCVKARFATWKYPEPPPGSTAIVHYLIQVKAEK